MELKALEAWVSLPDAARELGLSRQGMHYKVDTGAIPKGDLRWLQTGKQGRGIVLISRKRIDKMKESA